MKYLRNFETIQEVQSFIQNFDGNYNALLSCDEAPTPLIITSGEPGPDYSTPFYIENAEQEQGYVKVHVFVNHSADTPLSFEVEYSYDAEEWTSMGIVSVDNSPITSPVVNSGQRIYLRANTPSWMNGTLYSDYINVNEYATIEFSSSDETSLLYTVGGNIMSLIYGSNFTGRETTFPANTFGNFSGILGHNGMSVIDASELILPATELTPSCYDNLLQLYIEATIENSPILAKANTLAFNCYRGVSGLMYDSSSLAREDSIAYINNPLYNIGTHGYAIGYPVQ